MRLCQFLKQTKAQHESWGNTPLDLRPLTYDEFCRRKMSPHGIFPLGGTSDAEAIGILADYLLPDSWYAMHSIKSQPYMNTEIVAAILKDYPRRTEYSSGWQLVKTGVKRIWQNIFS